MRYEVSSFWLDLHLLLLGDRVEQDLRAEGLLAGFGDLGAVRIVFEPALLLEVAVHLVVDEPLRNRDVDLLEQLVDDLVAGLDALAELLRLGELLAQIAAELADGVELAGDLGEVVIGGRQLAVLDGEQGDRDLRLLALVVAAEQGGLEVGGLPRGQRVECLVDALDQLARAELVGDVARVVDLFAADRGGEVELHEVAGASRAVDGHQGAEAGAQVLELVLDVIHADDDRLDLELQAVVVRDVELGSGVDLDRDLEVAAEVVDARPLGDVGSWAPERTHLLGLGGRAVEGVETLVDRVVQHLGAADALVDDGRRHLALAEAGDVHVFSDVLVRVVDARLELFGRDGDVELHASGAELLDGRGDHGVSP